MDIRTIRIILDIARCLEMDSHAFSYRVTYSTNMRNFLKSILVIYHLKLEI